jgi:hypothetical protein
VDWIDQAQRMDEYYREFMSPLVRIKIRGKAALAARPVTRPYRPAYRRLPMN